MSGRCTVLAEASVITMMHVPYVPRQLCSETALTLHIEYTEYNS